MDLERNIIWHIKRKETSTYGVVISSSMLWGGVSSLNPESEVMVNSPPLLYPPAKKYT